MNGLKITGGVVAAALTVKLVHAFAAGAHAYAIESSNDFDTAVLELGQGIGICDIGQRSRSCRERAIEEFFDRPAPPSAMDKAQKAFVEDLTWPFGS